MSKKTALNGEFCWNELMTPDIKKAKDFYCALFNWESQTQDMGEFAYTMFKQGENMIGGMLPPPKGQEKQIPPHWLSYINVDNVEAFVKKAKDLGATIKVPVTPVSDFGKFAIIIDPTGAFIGLWQSLKEC